MSSLETEGCPLLFLQRAVQKNLLLETLEYLVIFEEFLNRNYVSRVKKSVFSCFISESSQLKRMEMLILCSFTSRAGETLEKHM